jgi:vesicle-fusing ATPase
MDCIERLIDYSAIGRRFSNSILQAILLLLEKSPPKEENRLLIIATTSAFYNMQQLDLTSGFDIK